MGKWQKGTAAKKCVLADSTVGTWSWSLWRKLWQTMNGPESFLVLGKLFPGGLFLALPVCLQQDMQPSAALEKSYKQRLVDPGAYSEQMEGMWPKTCGQGWILAAMRGKDRREKENWIFWSAHILPDSSVLLNWHVPSFSRFIITTAKLF